MRGRPPHNDGFCDKPNCAFCLRRWRILEFMRDYWAREKFCPTTREIADHLGLASASGVVVPLQWLTAQGYLERRHKVRGWVLTLKGLEALDSAPPAVLGGGTAAG